MGLDTKGQIEGVWIIQQKIILTAALIKSTGCPESCKEIGVY